MGNVRDSVVDHVLRRNGETDVVVHDPFDLGRQVLGVHVAPKVMAIKLCAFLCPQVRQRVSLVERLLIRT